MNKLFQSYFSFVRKLLPNRAEETSVGIDIGSDSCKIVEIKLKGTSVQIVHQQSAPIKKDVPTTLKSMLAEISLTDKPVYSAISGRGTLIRYISFPRMTLEDLRASFSIEADKYFPFAQDQIYTDCFVLDPQGKGRQMLVIAAAAKKEIVDKRLETFTEAGIETHFVGLNPIAMTNVYQKFSDTKAGKKDKAEVVGLLDIGGMVSSLIILDKGIPQFTRDIFVGGMDITKRVSNVMGVEMEEAEDIKCNPGEKRDQVIECAESALNLIIQELKLSIDYFSAENNRQVERIVLSGGAAQMEGMIQIFEKNLDVPVSLWDPVAEFLPDDADKSDSAGLGVALGLALQHYD